MEAKESGRIKINKFGQVIISSNDFKRLILEGKTVNHVVAEQDEEIELFKKYQKELLSDIISFENEDDISIEDFHISHSTHWTFPEEYQKLDIKAWLLSKCKNENEINRVNQEFILYEERGLLMVLRLFVYIVDYMRKNNFIWGVGRGSSVSSYILYLIGIHRVDSLKYNLDIKDFLK